MNSSVSGLNSEVVDMSDWGEAQRWAETHGENPGLGDAIYDSDDAEALRAFGTRN
jgi:hypothetical protein